ncbi:NADH-quinone oxidoreductase subunit C [Rhizorhabdus sp.]|uniref:NADH-quinone oxidoreductase subunit C n=1 Tax=Rhizorhabdus sp. TaxID=1968843 RepID=UPI0019AB1FAF|nr:NADH-quinone oxidoreductase subunit C [Rhizorhabdus sp.]MBD3761174.1 NADH-quinone oxidoreductase subunit C [Rhizorhabdus sp.]
MSETGYSFPRFASNDGVVEAATAALGGRLIEARECVGELALHIARDSLVETMRILRDDLAYQQLMEIAGVDYPDRPERFEVVYCLLSLTKNHRIRVHVATDEVAPVPSITGLWPVAGWLEREVFDMYGVLFDGNADLRRILTDYGFRGHPQRKDFPLTGYVELRYSEAHKRVVYEPVQLAQDFRSFDFMSPWEGADYILPGDEKVSPVQPGAPSPAPAKTDPDPVAAKAPAPTPKTTDSPSQTGAGKAANEAAAKPSAAKPQGGTE